MTWHTHLQHLHPHIQAKVGEIAETILLPGDPLRAKFIADTFLDDAKQFNETRNMFGYTGTYNGKPVSVMGTGMGCPSMGIYSYELINIYGCKNLIRIGTSRYSSALHTQPGRWYLPWAAALIQTIPHLWDFPAPSPPYAALSSLRRL